jgi:general stress protein 26
MSQDKRGHLIEVLQDFDVAMLHTRTASGGIRSRPMSLADVQDDGSVYFATSIGSEIIRDLEKDPRVEVSVQGKAKFATLSGTARISQDRELIHRLWKESWKLWFPEGKNDPNLCLIEFDATEGQYWDNAGAKGITFALKAAKAFVKGSHMEPASAESNAKVKF